MHGERESERRRGKEKEGCLSGVRTYLPGNMLQGCRLLK